MLSNKNTNILLKTQNVVKDIQNPLKHKKDLFINTTDSFKISKKVKKHPKTV